MKTILTTTDPRLPSLRDLHDYLHYSPSTGAITWKRRPCTWMQPWPKGEQGPEAGSLSPKARLIGFRGVSFKAHRLAWALHYGVWPTKCIDHINGDPHDNRICNLRECSVKENLGNTRLSKNNTSGFKGVYLRKDTGRWAALIKHNRKKISLGCYPTAELAAAAYDKAAKEIFGEFASPNHTLGTQHKAKTK